MSVDVEKLLNIIRREAESAARRHAMGWRFGIVQQYDPAGPAVRVSFPEDLDDTGQPTLSPWMPIVLPSAGPNAGACDAPDIGSQAFILHRGHGHERETFMLGTVRSSSDPAPADPAAEGQPAPRPGTPAGEKWMVHSSGSFLKVRPGQVQAGANGAAFQRLATEQFVLDVFNKHTHPYFPGNGGVTQTQPPKQQVADGDDANLTAQLKAN